MAKSGCWWETLFARIVEMSNVMEEVVDSEEKGKYSPGISFSLPEIFSKRQLNINKMIQYYPSDAHIDISL